MQEKYAKNAKKHGLSMLNALQTHAISEGWLLFTPSALRKEASPCFS
jgi:hypothetical protein